MSLLVKLNIDLYKTTTEAIAGACKHFGVTGNVNLHVYSSNINPKISQSELHEALRSSGASTVETDSRKIRYKVGNNKGTVGIPMVSNLHRATLTF